jgi:hypothetical protein
MVLSNETLDEQETESFYPQSTVGPTPKNGEKLRVLL